MFYFETFHIQLRVDPTYSEDNETPMRIALTQDDGGKMLEILTAFASMPDSVKLETLSILMWNVDREREKKLFQKLLGSLPLQLVRAFFMFLVAARLILVIKHRIIARRTAPVQNRQRS